MSSLKKVSIFVYCIFCTLFSQAQTDSTTLALDEYLKNILLFHPVAKKADLQAKLASAEWLSAKGNLDPNINSSWTEKNFDDKLYYRQFGGQFNVPTKLGVDLVGGYENTRGEFLNPENKTDEFGLWNLGVEVDVLQGLIINERKIALDQASVYQAMTENERQIMLNELLYKASQTYLLWQQYQNFQAVLDQNIALAGTFSENTKLSFQSGEKTAMDTLEASILFQDATNLFQKNEVTLIKIRQAIENFLWFEETPIGLQAGTRPEEYKDDLFLPISNTDVANLVNSHPLILSYENKQTYFEMGQRLKREKLKPKLKVKYNPLLATSENNIAPNFSLADYKWGFDFSMPILMRKERADIQKGEIKIQKNFLSLQQKRNELTNKIEGSIQQQTILRNQIVIAERNVEGYRLLLEGENEKFIFGESSVFLLNKRQEKFINGRLKLIELNIKLQLELLNFLYYSNQIAIN